MTTLTVANAAEVSGLSAHTLRYYERVALLEAHRAAVVAQLEETARNLELIDWKINLYRERLETP